VLLGAANRDPDRPDTSSDLTFSMGPHRCLGASQAQFLIEEAVARLTAELPEMALSRPPVHVANVAFNIHEELWVTVHPTA
jgi:cytochrome P450